MEEERRLSPPTPADRDAFTTLEGSPSAMVIHQHGLIIFANKEARKLVGAKDDEDLFGAPISDFLPDEFKIAYAARFANVVRGLFGENVHASLRRRDGSIVNVTSMVMPFRYAGKTAGLAILHAVDDAGGGKIVTEEAYRDLLKITVGREVRMQELKEQVEKLERELKELKAKG